jgi:formate hydrogenlyase regulatory protein HycA
MAVPNRIRISRQAKSYTHHLGIYRGCQQFMGFISATLPCPTPEDWHSQKRWYAVLHRFDPWGDHLGTEAWFAGTTADGEDLVCCMAREKLSEMIGALGKIMYCDVEVRLFQVFIDDSLFGLVDTSDESEKFEQITLQPNDLAFFAPWDGSYAT